MNWQYCYVILFPPAVELQKVMCLFYVYQIQIWKISILTISVSSVIHGIMMPMMVHLRIGTLHNKIYLQWTFMNVFIRFLWDLWFI